MIVAFFILLNFFLAIVVDNFMVVKEAIKEFNAENAIWVDLWDVVDSIYRYRRWKWPSRTRVINFLELRGYNKKGEASRPSVISEIGVVKLMMDHFHEFTVDSLVEYLTCYANKVDHDANMIVVQK